MKMITRTSMTLLGTMLACAACTAATADAITLRRSVRMRHADDSIRLGDIATLEGAYANEYADLVVARFEDRGSAMELSLDRIENALDKARANRARYDLSGGRVVVRPHASMNVHGTISACTPMKIETKGPETGPDAGNQPEKVESSVRNFVVVDPRSVVGEDTPRGLIAIRMAAFWRNVEAPVRLRIETDERMLLEAENRRPKIRTAGKDGDGSIAFDVTLEGTATFRVKTSIEVQTMTPRLRATTRKGTRVAHGDLDTQFEWIPLADHAKSVSGLGMIGGRLDENVKAGTLLLPRHFEPAVHRNDPIKVRSGGQGWVLELDCICLEDGRVGETIKVQTNTLERRRNRDERTMHVRVIDGVTAELVD